MCVCAAKRIGAVSFAFRLFFWFASAVCGWEAGVSAYFVSQSTYIKRRENILRMLDRVRVIIAIIIVIIGSISLNLIQIYSVDERGPELHIPIRSTNLKSANAHSVRCLTIHSSVTCQSLLFLSFYSFSFKLLSAALDMNVQVHAYSLHFVCQLNRVESVFHADFVRFFVLRCDTTLAIRNRPIIMIGFGAMKKIKRILVACERIE